jgi:hypothetical protein
MVKETMNLPLFSYVTASNTYLPNPTNEETKGYFPLHNYIILTLPR